MDPARHLLERLAFLSATAMESSGGEEKTVQLPRYFVAS
jgi:hypothetical protein